MSPDGKYLVVALGQADQVAIVELASGTVGLADVGAYPYGVEIDPSRPRAYVSNERDGTVSVISIPDGDPIATIPVGLAAGPVKAGTPTPKGWWPTRTAIAFTSRSRTATWSPWSIRNR